MRQVVGYGNDIANIDISLVDGVKRDSSRVKSIMRSLARHTANRTTNTAILSDINTNNEKMNIYPAIAAHMLGDSTEDLLFEICIKFRIFSY